MENTPGRRHPRPLHAKRLTGIAKMFPYPNVTNATTYRLVPA